MTAPATASGRRAVRDSASAGARSAPRRRSRLVRRPLPIPAVLVALLISLCPRGLLAQQPTAEDPLVGCYRVEVGRWGPRDHPDREHPVEPPAEFRLQAEIGTEPFERGRRLVRPLLRGGGRASWERLGADSVRISWGTGFWGTVLLMRIEGESLRGTATSWTDVLYVDADGKPSPDLQADVVARRTPCPTEPRGAWRRELE